MILRLLPAAFLTGLTLPVWAGPPEIEHVGVTMTGNGTARVDVTLSHPDTGWDHYADGWRIEDGDGAVLGVRDLLHPHVAEQPFTRSLSGVALPAGARHVLIRARCNVHGWADRTTQVDLPG